MILQKVIMVLIHTSLTSQMVMARLSQIVKWIISGNSAVIHTAAQVKKIQMAGVKVLSYFIEEGNYGGAHLITLNECMVNLLNKSMLLP
jgi:hypothetical protein